MTPVAVPTKPADTPDGEDGDEEGEDDDDVDDVVKIGNGTVITGWFLDISEITY